MTTRILFTRGRSPISWLICKLTREEVSHCALEFDNWVLHANFYGLHWVRKFDFDAGCSIVHAVEVNDDPRRLIRLAAEHAGKTGYDFGALFYLTLRYLLRSIGIRIPKKNLWQTTGMFLCTEWVTLYLDGVTDAAITPFKLFEKISHKEVETWQDSAPEKLSS